MTSMRWHINRIGHGNNWYCITALLVLLLRCARRLRDQADNPELQPLDDQIEGVNMIGILRDLANPYCSI